MAQNETPLQHRLSSEEFYDFLTACRTKAKTSLDYTHDEDILIQYLELRGVILPTDIAYFEMNHTFRSVSLMRSRDEIMKDAARYYKVYIKKYATVIDAALKNCENQSQEYLELLEKDVKAILLRLVKKLKSEGKYKQEAAFGFQYSLSVLQSCMQTDIKEKVGDLLVEIKYNDIFNIADVIGRAKLQDALECNNVYALTRMTLGTTIDYSDGSRRFALYITNFELLTTLSGHLTEILYLKYINEQSVSMIFDDVLNVVYNIAYHSDVETKHKFDAIKKALIDFPKVDNFKREIYIMLSLLYTMNEDELCSLSDESNVMDTIIKYLQDALEEEDRRKDGFSLHELADGLSKLTIQTSNRLKIVQSEGAISALVNMLRYDNVKENTSAILCIQALAQDSAVRNTLLEFPDLVPAMEDLRKTTSLKLKKIIDDILKT